jgi:hypothetical protein
MNNNRQPNSNCGNYHRNNNSNNNESRDSSVHIMTGYGLDGQDSIPGSDKKYSPIPKSSDPLWGPHSLLYSGYREFSPGGKAAKTQD